MQVNSQTLGGIETGTASGNLDLAAHARVRMQQRGIPADTVDLVLDYGRQVHDHRGAVICYLDKAARRRIERECDRGQLRVCGRALNAYVVLSTEGSVMTVGHRYRRIRR